MSEQYLINKIIVQKFGIKYFTIYQCITFVRMIYDMIYLLTAIGLTPGGSSTVHIYTQTVHRTTQ